MLLLPNSFQALSKLCAILEIKQEKDQTLRVKVKQIKEQCESLLKAPLDQAERTLQRLTNLLNPLLANDKLTPDLEAFVEHLNEIKSDAPSRKELCADLVSMDDYGLEGDEDEQTKKQMRIDAFEAAINSARSEMQINTPSGSYATIHNVLKMQAGHTAVEVKQTTLHIKPSEEEYDDLSTKGKKAESDDVVEEKIKKDLELYKSVCVDKLRPDNVTMQNLYAAIMRNFYLFEKQLDLENISTSKDLKKAQSYFTKLLITLLENHIITSKEGKELFEVFYKDHNLDGILDEDRIFEVEDMNEQKWENTKEISIAQQEEYSLKADKNQIIFNIVCNDDQRPDNLTMQDLFSALMHHYALQKVAQTERITWDIDTEKDLREMNHYLENKISGLLQKNIISPNEADDLRALARGENTKDEEIKPTHRPQK